MITCRVYHDGSLKQEKPFEARTIDEARDADQRVWIDVIDPTDDELSELQAKLSLHERKRGADDIADQGDDAIERHHRHDQRRLGDLELSHDVRRPLLTSTSGCRE